MDMFEVIGNELVIGAHAMLTEDASLTAATAAFDEATGDTRSRLVVAITAAAQVRLRPVELAQVPPNLDNLTVPELRTVASQNDVSIVYSMRRDELIRAIRRDAEQRIRLSRLTPIVGLEEPALPTPRMSPTGRAAAAKANGIT